MCIRDSICVFMSIMYVLLLWVYMWGRFIYTKIFAFIKKNKKKTIVTLCGIYVIYVGVTFVGYVQGRFIQKFTFI